MRPVPTQKRIHPFAVVFCAAATGEPVMLRTACDANRATLAFHAELQRLAEHPRAGELLLLEHDERPRTLLRQPLR